MSDKETRDRVGSSLSNSIRQGGESALDDGLPITRNPTESDVDPESNKMRSSISSMRGSMQDGSPKLSPKANKNDVIPKTPQKGKKFNSKQATRMSDDFSTNKNKGKKAAYARQTKTSLVGDFPGSKQSTAENMVKASYKLTEDILDPDKNSEPWVNSARENHATEVVCSNHADAPVIMHCKTCDRLVCDECITTTHKPHDLIEIRKQGLQDKLILEQKLPDVRERAIPAIQKNLENLTHTKVQCSKEFDNMVGQIKQRSSDLILAIESARDRLINRSIADKDASHAFLNKLEDKLANGLVAIEAATSSSEDAMNLDKDHAVVHERIKLQWLLNKYRRSHPHIIYPRFQSGTAAREEAALEKMIGYFEGMLKCEAKDQIHKIVLNVLPLGSLKPSYFKTIPYSHKIRTACQAGDDKICIIPVVHTTSFDFMSSNGVSVVTQVRNLRIYDITKTMDNQFLVSDPKSRKIMRVTQTGVVIKWTNVNGIPRGIHSCKNGDILVCLVDSVGFTHSKYLPHKQRCIVRMNEDFKIIDTYGQKDEIFNIPDRVFENMNGDICVIDRIGGLDSRLVVLDNHGEVRFEYPGEGGFDGAGVYGDGYIPVKRQAYSDVCCDGYANIYIADERNNEIIVLDQDGIEQREIAEIFAQKREKAETNIAAPHRLVIDHNGQIWILQRRKISLFKLYN